MTADLATMTALDRSFAAAGGAAELARRIGVVPSAPINWKSRGTVPEIHCPAIERAVSGSVTVEELRPDVRWQRVPDPDWPHPKGRPCIDVAAPAANTEGV